MPVAPATSSVRASNQVWHTGLQAAERKIRDKTR